MLKIETDYKLIRGIFGSNNVLKLKCNGKITINLEVIN
jgi:hypothetical protein